MRTAGSVILLALGCLWPFAAHFMAMTRLYPTLLRDPRLWLAYNTFIVLLPCPALLYSGFALYLRPRMPYPGRAMVAAAASVVALVIVSVIFALIVGGVGFSVPV